MDVDTLCVASSLTPLGHAGNSVACIHHYTVSLQAQHTHPSSGIITET